MQAPQRWILSSLSLPSKHDVGQGEHAAASLVTFAPMKGTPTAPCKRREHLERELRLLQDDVAMLCQKLHTDLPAAGPAAPVIADSDGDALALDVVRRR